MFSEKLLVLLSTFSKYDLNRFRKFLLSPYFNEQEDLIRLFDLCNNALRKGGGSPERLEKSKIWTALYPERKNLDDAHLRRMASDLTQLSMRFLAMETRKKDPLKELIEIQQALQKPELKRHLSAVEQSFYKTAAQQNVPSGLYYLDTFQFHWNIFNRASKVVSMADFMQKLLATDLELDRLYIVHKLKIYISWLIFSGFRSTDDEMVIITGFWDYLTHAQFKDEPLIRIYLDIVDALKNLEEEQYYRELMRNLEKYGDSISKDDLRECYYFAQNYCAFKVNQGKIEYYREVFEIFRRIIQMGLLLEENQVSEGVYKNIITASLGVGEFKWAENFIRDYSGYLPPAIRENAMSYNLSYLYFNQKEYSRVIELLRDVEYSDVSYALSAKVLLLRTYYELGEMIALDSLIDSFRIYLRRNKVISKRLKRESNNFLNFLKRLAVLEDKKITGTSALKKRIMENPSIVSKKWLLEKVDEMENRH